MDSCEAMNVLARAGRRAEAQEIVEREAEAAQAEYRSIEADETRTAEFKRHEIQRAYEARRTRLDEKLANLAKSAAKAEQQDAIRLFGTADLPGDTASLTISRRDAADRVASVQNRQELQELLSRANRSGDEVLARAVAEKALELRDVDTLNAFLADRPQLDAAAQRLWDAARRGTSAQARLQHTMLLSGLRPPETARR